METLMSFLANSPKNYQRSNDTVEDKEWECFFRNNSDLK